MENKRIDLARRITVTVSAVICVVGTLYGLGLLGTEVQDSSGGRLAADATLIAPAGPAFTIWSVIYVGLAAFTIWQWTPAAGNPRTRAIGWLAAASMLLNAGWLLVTQFGWLPASVAVIVALLAVLLVLNRRLAARPPVGMVERVVVDGTFGLYLGWVSVATFANIAATVTDPTAASPSGLAQAAAVATLLIVSAVGVLLARLLGGKTTVAAAMAWGLAWIAIGRTTDQPRSVATAIAAIVAAAVVAAATTLQRHHPARTTAAHSDMPRR